VDLANQIPLYKVTTRSRAAEGPQRPGVRFQSAGPMAYEHGVTLDFSRPGKPTDNAYVESLRTAARRMLNANWFLSLEDAQTKIEAWRQEYNVSRPHTALGHVPPADH